MDKIITILSNSIEILFIYLIFSIPISVLLTEIMDLSPENIKRWASGIWMLSFFIVFLVRKYLYPGFNKTSKETKEIKGSSPLDLSYYDDNKHIKTTSSPGIYRAYGHCYRCTFWTEHEVNLIRTPVIKRSDAFMIGTSYTKVDYGLFHTKCLYCKKVSKDCHDSGLVAFSERLFDTTNTPPEKSGTDASSKHSFEDMIDSLDVPQECAEYTQKMGEVARAWDETLLEVEKIEKENQEKKKNYNGLVEQYRILAEKSEKSGMDVSLMSKKKSGMDVSLVSKNLTKSSAGGTASLKKDNSQ